jgi:hypothetical protein
MTHEEEELLCFLRDTTEENPFDLVNAYGLNDARNKNKLALCIRMGQEKYFDGTKKKAWITQKGRDALEKLGQERLKNRGIIP